MAATTRSTATATAAAAAPALATTRPAASSYGASDNESHAQLASAAGARGSADENGADAQSNASSNDHINDKAAGPPLTKRQRVRRHCGRFWLWYLIATILFLAIFLPILFKIIIPAIVQSIINSQGLPIAGGGLECISATQVKIALNTSLDAPIPARLSDFSLGLYNKDAPDFTPFLNLSIPGQKINGDTKVIIPWQLVTIEDESELVRWFDQIFDTEKADVSLAGRPTIHLGELSSNPTIAKTISLPGLRRLSGIGITDLKIMFPPDKSGNNLKGTINIPNSGVLMLNFGNITFDIFSGAVKLGKITTYDVLLNVGNNTLNFDGYLDLPNLVKNFGLVLESQKAALNRGQVDLNVTATNVMVHGERIPYIEKVLGRRPLTPSISVITLISDVLAGFLGGGGTSIVNALGDVVGNNTFLQNVIDNYNHTQSMKKASKPTLLSKRAPNPKDALMWNMLKLGLRMKLNQASR
ncbi:hypothetical protein E4U43_002502 [Claviceps pusilla]|uniref:Uncharacterized protein n=1 Tax=Claviceps pusilla TaxID=123648 RepID=A0A9P7N8N4_9HYPO|nr:hypothetical protein E4U43_002502 [Claviceps pusilla]